MARSLCTQLLDGKMTEFLSAARTFDVGGGTFYLAADWVSFAYPVVPEEDAKKYRWKEERHNRRVKRIGDYQRQIGAVERVERGQRDVARLYLRNDQFFRVMEDNRIKYFRMRQPGDPPGVRFNVARFVRKHLKEHGQSDGSFCRMPVSTLKAEIFARLDGTDAAKEEVYSKCVLTEMLNRSRGLSIEDDQFCLDLKWTFKSAQDQRRQ